MSVVRRIPKKTTASSALEFELILSNFGRTELESLRELRRRENNLLEAKSEQHEIEFRSEDDLHNVG